MFYEAVLWFFVCSGVVMVLVLSLTLIICCFCFDFYVRSFMEYMRFRVFYRFQDGRSNSFRL